MRMLTTETRNRLQEVLSRLANGHSVTLEERIQLQKYAKHIPFVSGLLLNALRRREELEKDGLI